MLIFKECLSYLTEYVYTPYFTKEIVNNERGIITEEINMYEDKPGTQLIYGTYNNIFIKDERQYLVSGTVSDVKKITKEDLEICYEAFYHPENMFMIITGNFDPNEAVAIVSEVMSKKEFPKYNKPVLKFKKEPF
ncbi:MAG: insulinase family protein [Clostridium sp.]|nr:MAG: insulinase family protein [Clostridium sp.]